MPKTAASKLKMPLKRQISTFYFNSFCVDLILPIWIKFVKDNFVYFEFKIFSFQPLLVLKRKMPPRMKIIIFEFLVLIKYFSFIISILGILVQAHQKNLVQAIVQCTHVYWTSHFLQGTRLTRHAEGRCMVVFAHRSVNTQYLEISYSQYSYQ